MADPYYNRLRLNILVQMLTYNPNKDFDVSTPVEMILNDLYESENLEIPYQHTPILFKDDADIEIMPASFTGVKFVFMKVLTENLSTTPDNGTINVKITSTNGGTDQLINGNLFMRSSKEADITSIKITNNEDDLTGVSLPVAVVLGGMKT